MDKNQRGYWAIGIPYSGGGGTMYGTYGEFCDARDRLQPVSGFEPEGKKLFICPKNDAEAVAIVELIKEKMKSEPEIDIIVTEQGWGASWENLEPKIKTAIEDAKKNGVLIYGVELQGDSKGAENIDHHIYGDDDRSNWYTSIEQVAHILKVSLNKEQKFIAANDKGFIPEMQRLGAKLGLEGEDLQAIIDNVRMKDRMAQGITAEQEEQAQKAVEALGDLSEKRDLIMMDLPHSKTATVTDRLFGKYDNLLVTSADGETNFFGKTDVINALNEKYKQVDENGRSNCWCGGQLDQGNGFWGGYVDQDSVKETVASEVEKLKEQEKLKEIEQQEDQSKEMVQQDTYKKFSFSRIKSAIKKIIK